MNQPPLRLSLPRSFYHGKRSNRVQSEDPMGTAGRKVLRKLLLELMKHPSGVIAGIDPESVHDMRVTVRRLRAALNLFAGFLPKKAVKSQLQTLRRLGRLLGRVRDLEVMLADARNYEQSLPQAQQAAFAPWVDYLQAQRVEARGPLIELLKNGGFDQYLLETIPFLSDIQPPKPEAPGQPSRVCDVAPHLILEKLGDLRSFETQIASLSLERLHGLRGNLKRLRYTLEYFQEPLGSQSRVLQATLKGLQDYLGRLNDTNMTARAVQEFQQAWEASRTDQSTTGRPSSVPFLTYLTHLLEQRDDLVKSFPEVWSVFNTIDFRRRLTRTVARL